MKTDINWLSKWQPSLIDKHVLELGCGEGIDTKLLLNLATEVTACDHKINQTTKAKFKEENLKLLKLDHSKPLPFDAKRFDVVVASLSLHYFKWDKTINIVNEISRVLTQDGLLICRLNSTNDINYGAVGHSEIEDGLFDVHGSPKRFFSEKNILSLFSNWIISGLKEETIDRYWLPKVVWEFAVKKQ